MTGIFRCVHSAVFWFLVFFYSISIHAACSAAACFTRTEDKKREFYRKGARLWGSLLVGASLLKVKISGLENIPGNTNVIFAPNHQSYLDVFILLKYLPGAFTFVIMRKLFKVPVIGSHIREAGFLSLDRKDRKKSIRTIHTIIDMIKAGESFVIFPEGKLTRDGSVGEFGRGTSIVIQRAGRPVVPIAIDGAFDALPGGAWILRQAEVRVNIGRPVHFEDYYGEINKGTSYKLGNRLREIVVGLKGNGGRKSC